MAKMVKKLPAVLVTWVRTLEDPPEKGMTTCSTILALEVSWTGDLMGYRSWVTASDITEQQTHTSTSH